MHVCSVVAGNTTSSACGIPFKTVGDRDQDVLRTSRFKFVEHPHLELGAFSGLDPQA